MWLIPQSLVMFLLLILLFFSILVYSGLYEKFLFYPMQQIGSPPAINGIDCKPITLTENHGEKHSEQLGIWFYKQAND